MKKGIILLVLVLNFAALLSSCFQGCDRYKFYDYEGIEVGALESTIGVNDSLLLLLTYTGDDFVAEVLQTLVSSSSLLAFGCDKGWGGAKFPLTRITITSDADFNNEYLAGDDLGELVFALGSRTLGTDMYAPITDFSPDQVNVGFLYLTSRPTLAQEHQFTIELEKDNGEVVSATSDLITWE